MVEPFLEWVDENQVKQKITVIDKVFIGRTCKGINLNKCVIVNHPDVSRDHAEVSLIDSKLYLMDRSKNGTRINEIRVKPGYPVVLEHGDKIRIVNILFSVNCFYNQKVVEKDKYFTNLYTSPPTIIKRNTKIFTQLVADVRNFTKMSQKLKSEQLYLFIKEIFEALSSIVNDYKGTIKDYAGDGVFAFWEHGDDYSKERAILACRAAIKQIDVIMELQSKLFGTEDTLEKLELGWGITTGQSIMSHYGSIASDIALVGDKINLAFRLSSMANKDFPEEVLLCSKTASLVKDKLILENLGRVAIRGCSKQETIYAIGKPQVTWMEPAESRGI